MIYPRVVYAIKHIPTGKIYVGSTSNIHRRMQGHFGCLRRGDHPIPEMQADNDNYGGRYVVYLLEIISRHADRHNEHIWMDALKTRDPKYGYNMRDPSTPIELTPPRSFLGPVLQEVDLRKRHLAEKFQ